MVLNGKKYDEKGGNREQKEQRSSWYDKIRFDSKFGRVARIGMVGYGSERSISWVGTGNAEGNEVYSNRPFIVCNGLPVYTSRSNFLPVYVPHDYWPVLSVSS